MRRDEPWHGTFNGYNHRRCRCDECRRANTERLRITKKARRERVAQGFRDFEHGEQGYSNWSCRCETCSAAWSKKMRENHPVLSPEARERASAKAKVVTKKENDESRLRARNHSKEWTGPELELISRPDLSVKEATDLLGRTIAAVQHARRRIRIDPRKANYL